VQIPIQSFRDLLYASPAAEASAAEPIGPTMKETTTRLYGIGAIVLATGAFVANDSCMKTVMADAPPLQVLFMRGLAASLICLPLVFILGHGARLRHALNGWVIARALSESFAVVCFVVALARMPIADITAIYQISPLLIVAGAALIWGEKVGPLRMLLIALGIIGALLVAQPGATAASSYAVLGFGTALGSAVRDIISRKVKADVPALIVTFVILVVVMAVAGLATALFETWVVPAPRHIGLMAVAGTFLVGAQFAVFSAYRLATAQTLAPFYYASTVWAVAAGALVFGQLPNGLALVGIALILVSGVAVVMIDRRRAARAA
jgi:drug/metabolite transporter (DMT)-like permease